MGRGDTAASDVGSFLCVRDGSDRCQLQLIRKGHFERGVVPEILHEVTVGTVSDVRRTNSVHLATEAIAVEGIQQDHPAVVEHLQLDLVRAALLDSPLVLLLAAFNP